jgi:hypothetical protein
MTVELRARVLDNPFYVLELDPECSRAEIERGMAGSERYPTPFGSGRRDPAKIREAMAELRDPQRRLLHELWVRGAARADLPITPIDTTDFDGADLPGFEQAPTSLGWRSRP